MSVKRIQQSVPGSTAPDVQPPTPPPVVQPSLVPPPHPVSRVPPAPPKRDEVVYPYEDDIAMASSPEQETVMVETRHALDNYFVSQPNVYLGMDMLVFDTEGDNTKCLAPDIFVTFDVRRPVEKSYRIWEVGKPPDVVWEFGSASTWKGDATKKKQRYRQWGVSEYWLFDPQGDLHNPRLQGFQLVNGRYRRLPSELRGSSLLSVKSPLLGLEQHFDGQRLRLWDPVAKEYLRTGRESERERLKAEARLERECARSLEADKRAAAAEERAAAAEAQAAELRAENAELRASVASLRK